MFVFISYAHEQKSIAEEIASSLSSEVFFDRDSLPPGREFHSRIREAVGRSDALIFLISPQSVAKGCYALTELKYAREKWPRPEQRVFPVMVETTDRALIPGYIRGLTFYEPEGNIAAEVADIFADWVPPDEPGLPEPFERTGVPPVRPDLPPPPPPGLMEVLPGSWRIQTVYPNGMIGQAEAQFFANGMFQLQGSSPLPAMFTISGSWQIISGNMILLSGQQMVAYQYFPFTVTLTFSQITQSNMAGMLSSGESTTWYRIA